MRVLGITRHGHLTPGYERLPGILFGMVLLEPVVLMAHLIARHGGCKEPPNPAPKAAGKQCFIARRLGLPKQSFDGLKNRQKHPFIQQLAAHDFALGSVRNSWHK